jgi:hypothetical protein
VGAITYGAQQLGLAIEVQNFSATNFENKGVRQGISTDKQLNTGKKKLLQEFRKQWLKNHLIV